MLGIVFKMVCIFGMPHIFVINADKEWKWMDMTLIVFLMT